MNEGGALAPIETYLPQLESVLEQYGVALAYLYGSQAQGTAGLLSDVDVAVLFKHDVPTRERFERVLKLHGDLAEIFKRDDVNIVDLADGTPLLNNNVRRYGQVLYCADERERVAFEIETLHRYVDTEPLRREQNTYRGEKMRRGLYGRRIPIARER